MRRFVSSGEALVLAAVAGLHVEDGDVQALGGDGRQARVGVAQDEERVGLRGDHELVRAVDDVADGGAEVVADGVHVHLGVFELQILEEHAVEVVVVVLPGMCRMTSKCFRHLSMVAAGRMISGRVPR